MKDKVSGAIAIPKASWGCAPALPNRMQVVFLEVRFSIISRRRNKKFFDPAIFQGNTAQLPNDQKYDIIEIWKDK